jgi:urease accessory protein
MAFMRLMQLTSPSLPVGAFAYSQGLESAVEHGLLKDFTSASNWIRSIMHDGLARLELPLFYRLYDAWQADDSEQLKHLNQQLFAQRETSELSAEDAHMGGALARLLKDLGIAGTEYWQRGDSVSFTTMFALAAVRWEIDIEQAATGLLWSWMENQVAAAIKLVPLGQTDGQRLIGELLQEIPPLVIQARQLSDEEIGSSLPMLAILSAQHETQYSRLFRS